MLRLTLRKETLSELTTGDLAAVVGGSYPSKYDCTESYQVCSPVSVKVCVPTQDACFTTAGCG